MPHRQILSTLFSYVDRYAIYTRCFVQPSTRLTPPLYVYSPSRTYVECVFDVFSSNSQLSLSPHYPHSLHDRMVVCAESLVEYKWPLNDSAAETFMIQEQVSQFLDILSFKRKYPGLYSSASLH